MKIQRVYVADNVKIQRVYVADYVKFIIFVTEIHGDRLHLGITLKQAWWFCTRFALSLRLKTN